MRCQSGFFLQSVHQAGPTWQRQKFGLKDFRPFSFSDRLPLQIIQDDV